MKKILLFTIPLFIAGGLYFWISNPNSETPEQKSFLLVMYGCASASEKDIVKAMNYANEAIEICPNNDEAYRLRACLYLDMGNFEKATADFLKASELNAYHGGVYFYIGEKREFDKAFISYRNLISSMPSSSDKSTLLAECGMYHEWTKYITEAMKCYNEAIEINPSNASAYHGRGNLYGFMCVYDKSLADHKKANKLNPVDELQFIIEMEETLKSVRESD